LDVHIYHLESQEVFHFDVLEETKTSQQLPCCIAA